MFTRSLAAPALALLVSWPLAAETKTFQTDTTHTVLGFKAATVLFDVPGRFERYSVAISGDPATLQNVSIKVEIDAASINTGVQQRDDHLRSRDFFDVSRHAKILFTANKARREGDKVLVSGTLTMRGVAKPLEIPFRSAQGMNSAGQPTWSYRASLPLSRKDFGVGSDSLAAQLSLKEEVELDLLLVGSF